MGRRDSINAFLRHHDAVRTGRDRETFVERDFSAHLLLRDVTIPILLEHDDLAVAETSADTGADGLSFSALPIRAGKLVLHDEFVA